MKKTKGSTPFAALILIGIFILILSAGAYYFMQFTKPPTVDYNVPLNKTTETDEVGVSTKDDVVTIEAELDAMEIGSIEEDFENLEADLQEL